MMIYAYPCCGFFECFDPSCYPAFFSAIDSYCNICCPWCFKEIKIIMFMKHIKILGNIVFKKNKGFFPHLPHGMAKRLG